MNRDTSNNSYAVEVNLRPNLSSFEKLRIYPNKMDLYQYSSGNYTVLTENTSATSTQDVWYDVYVRCDGANITVSRAQRGTGVEMAQVLSTSSAAVTSAASFIVTPAASASYALDDFRLVANNLTSTTTYTYFNANKLTASTSPSDGNMTYSYDTWGRMVTEYQSEDHLAAYTYRYDSKLCTVTSTIPDESDVTNNYDGVGKLRSITTGGATKKLRWDAGWHPINLEDANGNLTTTFVHDPAREAAGSLLAAHVGSNPESGGTWVYLSQDHLGSTRHLRGQDRASLGTYEYTPYGDPYIATGMDLPQKFTGHWQIPQAGLYYAPYRMYAPGLARWLTRDPEDMAEGPNVYGYVRANPVRLVDLLGGSSRPDRLECQLRKAALVAAINTAVVFMIGSSVAAGFCIHSLRACIFGGPLACAGTAVVCIVAFVIEVYVFEPPAVLAAKILLEDYGDNCTRGWPRKTIRQISRHW
jgi:RHS repeat-associated protein